MQDGSRHVGAFINGSNRTITFEENGQQRQYDLVRVVSIQFDRSVAFRDGQRPGAYADRSVRDVAGRTIPSGTEVAVRANEPIQSANADMNRTFSAQVDRDVTDSSGQVVIPRGSPAQLVIRDASGGATSSRELILDLQSVTVNGNTYFI